MENNFIDGFFKGTLFENGYGFISRQIMRDKTLSRDSKAIYCYLHSFAGTKMTAFPSWKTICEELGFKSKDTYYKYINELKEHGLIKIEQLKEDGKWAKNIYTLALNETQVEEFKTFPKKQETEKLGNGKIGKRKKQESNNNNSLNNNNILNEEDEETPTVDQVDKDIVNAYKENINYKFMKKQEEFFTIIQKKYSKEFILKLIDVCAERNASSIGYLSNTLKDWDSNGLTTVEDIVNYLNKWSDMNKKAKENKIKKVKKAANEISNNKGNFNNYEQRTYDFDDLERKLLGWDK